MNTRYLILSAAVSIVFTSPSMVGAQKGTGAATGMGQELVKPTTEMLSGTVTSIKTGACEKTTGRALIGNHLLLQTADKKTINLHLGPSAADVVKEILATVKDGSKVEAVAFQTSRLPADQFVAKSITVDGKTLRLRDDNLRPSWAGAAGVGAGRGMGQGPCFW